METTNTNPNPGYKEITIDRYHIIYDPCRGLPSEHDSKGKHDNPHLPGILTIYLIEKESNKINPLKPGLECLIKLLGNKAIELKAIKSGEVDISKLCPIAREALKIELEHIEHYIEGSLYIAIQNQ
jgi:hypothetical protein